MRPNKKEPSTILLIDDDPLVRSTCRRILEHAGYITISAADGNTALALLQSNSGIDLVVMDLMMPGMNGAQLLDELGRSRVNVPVVVMSGYTDGMLTPNAHERLAGFLSKPFSARTLTHMVGAAMSSADTATGCTMTQ